MKKRIPLEKLKKAYLQAANIVSLYGEKYLPIFERIEKEYHRRKQRIDSLNRAIELSQSNKKND